MKQKTIGRYAAVVAAALAVGAATAPASAFDLKDLGIDLRKILGQGQRTDTLGLAERILESELPRHVGPAQKYQVRIGRDGNDLLRGRFGQVDVTGIDVKTSDGLVIPKMDLTLHDVQLNLLNRSLDSVGRSLFSLGVGEEAVSRFVQKRAGAGVRDVRVAFRNGQVVVNATPELLGFPLPSEVAGKPVMNGLESIDFRASHLSVAGLRIPRFGVNMLEEKINPVVDLSGLKLPVQIRNFRIEGNRLVADGIAAFGRR
jgi:hypothetical protein